MSAIVGPPGIGPKVVAEVLRWAAAQTDNERLSFPDLADWSPDGGRINVDGVLVAARCSEHLRQLASQQEARASYLAARSAMPAGEPESSAWSEADAQRKAGEMVRATLW